MKIEVAPLVGAWIEILANQGMQNLFAESHPSWVRGLKYNSDGSVPPST